MATFNACAVPVVARTPIAVYSGEPKASRVSSWSPTPALQSLPGSSALIAAARTTMTATWKSVRSCALSSSARQAVVCSAEVVDKPTILLAEQLDEPGLELLKKVANVDCAYNLSHEELCAKIQMCDAVIVRSGTKVTREVFQASKGRLKVVGRAVPGSDSVDLQAAKEVGCVVVDVAPTPSAISAAEYAIAQLITLSRKAAPTGASLHSGERLRNKYNGVSLVDKIIAVMGLTSEVGSDIARRAESLGMVVIGHDVCGPPDHAGALGVEMVSFDEALARADFIALHMPFTPISDKIFNDESFAKMKKGVRIVNVAVAGVIDEDALVRALDSGIVAQAALDASTLEVSEETSKLIEHENAVVTSPLGATTTEEHAVEIAEAVVGALQGELAATAVWAGVYSELNYQMAF